MTDPIDFPPSPEVGQRYTAPSGAVYSWDGSAWTIGFYNSATQQLQSVGDIIDQIRTLLQDTDVSGGEFRYSTDSIVMNINMGMLEMYRVRPDIFLANNFTIPQYNVFQLDTPLVIEPQWVPPLIYYAVGMTQARDDEGTQDTRASAFLTKFLAMLITMA